MKHMLLLAALLCVKQSICQDIKVTKVTKDTVYVDLGSTYPHECNIEDCPFKGKTYFYSYANEEWRYYQKIHFYTHLSYNDIIRRYNRLWRTVNL